jgi:hypothetical protein
MAADKDDYLVGWTKALSQKVDDTREEIADIKVAVNENRHAVLGEIQKLSFSMDNRLKDHENQLKDQAQHAHMLKIAIGCVFVFVLIGLFKSESSILKLVVEVVKLL